MRLTTLRSGGRTALRAGGLCVALAGPAVAGSYEFVPAPQIDLNRVYRVDKVTGEVTSCQYGLREGAVGSVGLTVCYGAGEGASAQVASKTAQQAIVAYVLTTGGLMANLSLEGTKITPLAL